MQRILSTRIKPLDFLLQRATTYLELRPKNVGFFFKELNLLRSVSHASRYQLWIIRSRPVASKGKTLSYWPITITASTEIDFLLVLDGLIFIVALILSNCKASGEGGVCLIINE